MVQIVFPERGEIISAGNFHGEYPAKAMDYLAIGVHELASMSERRVERLVNPGQNKQFDLKKELMIGIFYCIIKIFITTHILVAILQERSDILLQLFLQHIANSQHSLFKMVVSTPDLCQLIARRLRQVMIQKFRKQTFNKLN